MIKYDAIKKYADIHPDKIALKDTQGAYSWLEFKLCTQQLIDAINQLIEIQDGDLCLFITRNSNGVVLLGAAFSTLEIPFQGVDYNLDVSVIEKLIKTADVKHIFISKEFENKFNGLFRICQIHSIDHLINSAKRMTEDEYPTLPNATKPFKSYSFTSGTTGSPKIAYRTRSFDNRRFVYLQEKYSFNINDVHLTCLPMYHVSSTGWLRLFLGLGCTVIIHNFNNGYDLCETIHANDIYTTIMSPIMLKLMIAELTHNQKEVYFSTLRFIITGGKNCTQRLKANAIKMLGPVIYEYYGTTETGINTLLNSEEALNYPVSVGRDFEGNDIKILNNKLEPVKTGEIGRIAIYSYMNMDTYLDDSAQFILINENKYLLTSDYGYKNHEGYLYLAQRTSHIPSNIYNFYEIENELLNLTYLSDVHVTESNANNAVYIDVVPGQYYPFTKVRSDINQISEKYGVLNPIVKVTPMLDYTLTGKIKSSPSTL